MMKIADAIRLAEIDRLDAEVLLAHALQRDRAWLLAHSGDAVTQDAEETFLEYIARRKKQEPIAYITGTKEFYGREFAVDRRVLIPRPATETLIEETLKYYREGLPSSPVITEADTDVVAFSEKFRGDTPELIVDVGTGSGCIGITLALELPDVPIICSDVSGDALELAKKNAETFGTVNRIVFAECDGLPLEHLGRPFLLVSNPPYIPEGTELQTTVRDFEPHRALFAGGDGMHVLFPLYREAKSHPRCTGCIMELGLSQAKKIMSQE